MHQLLKNSPNLRMWTAAGLAMTIVLLSGCASHPAPPVASLNAAERAIAMAEQADAQQYAGAELDEARQKLLMAERAVNTESMVEAERLAQESRVAAELALALTDAAKAEIINRQIENSVKALTEEMRRSGEY